ncbi:MAG: cobalamin-dependent protein [Dethiobacteria bacterium]
MPGEVTLADLAMEKWPGRLRSYKRGKILYWQGDPVENLYAIRSGAVKISSLSSGGRIFSHGILGSGRLLGTADYFLDGIHETTAEVIEESSLVKIPLPEFQEAVARDAGFSTAVMRELARESKVHLSRTRELSFLDVQQRLKQSLVELARVHGLATDEGIELGVNLTHEEMGALINANRTTITLCLQELKKLGYIRIRGRKIILLSPHHMEILDNLCEKVISGGVGEAADLARQALEESIDPVKTLNALLNGIKEVDRRYAQGQMDINDIMWAAINIKEALQIIEAAIRSENISLNYLGRVVIGTVHGDIHDIGKSVAAMLLRARGFEVIDLGVDVAVEDFVGAVREYRPDVLAMSALLTSTQLEMQKVIDALRAAGMRDQVKVMVGGASITARFAKEIGADGYAHEARDGAELTWGWCSNNSRRN